MSEPLSLSFSDSLQAAGLFVGLLPSAIPSAVYSILVGLVNGCTFLLEPAFRSGYSVIIEENGGANGKKEDKQTLLTNLWTYYFQAFLHETCGEYYEGVAMADRSIAYNPLLWMSTS